MIGKRGYLADVFLALQIWTFVRSGPRSTGEGLGPEENDGFSCGVSCVALSIEFILTPAISNRIACLFAIRSSPFVPAEFECAVKVPTAQPWKIRHEAGAFCRYHAA